ncbi:MAG: response regulator [Theionarchaea archaeon]|nr:response regulator [Theionarchaea archaeon]
MKSSNPHQPRILYIEDDPKSRLIVRKLLESAGCTVFEAADGRDGIEKAQTVNPDAILIDIMLPVMNGLEVTRKVKEIEEIADTPIIALTAKAMAGDREQILAAGCDEYLAKPINIPVLLKTLSRVLNKELSLVQQESSPQGMEGHDATATKTFLIVDDTPKNVMILEKVFTAEGYTVLTAPHGKAALEILKDSKVDLIISDIAMPVMDGYRFCYEAMQDPEMRDIHFIFYSSHYSNEDEVDFGLTLGAERYLVRPLAVKELVKLVKEVLRHEKKPVHPMKWEEFSPLHDRLLTSKIVEIAPQAEPFNDVDASKTVEMGRSYLVEEKTPEKSYTMFLKQLSQGVKGLLLTRTHPRFIKKQYNFEKTPFIWLSTTASEEFKSTTDLTEISLSVKHFISITEKSIILLDGYEYLASKMGFTVMLQFLQSLNEFVSSHDSILLIPVDPETLNQKELRILERELTPLS